MVEVTRDGARASVKIGCCDDFERSVAVAVIDKLGLFPAMRGDDMSLYLGWLVRMGRAMCGEETESEE